MLIENYVVLVLKLTSGVQAIQPPRMAISLRRAAQYARAAAYHGMRKEVDPFELLALARNESDFNEKAVGPDGLDCGVTQTRITYSRYTCEQLQHSSWIAFGEAARELHAYAQSCRGQKDFDRCRLNKYNSGTRYAKRGVPGRYYLRVSCFAEAARRRETLAGQRCRQVRSEEELALLFHREQNEERSAENVVAMDGPKPACAGPSEEQTHPALAEGSRIDAPEPADLDRALLGSASRSWVRALPRRKKRPFRAPLREGIKT